MAPGTGAQIGHTSIQKDADEARILTTSQEEKLVELRALLAGYPIYDPEDANDDFVVAATAFLALDLERVATSIQALAAAVPILHRFGAVCETELILPGMAPLPSGTARCMTWKRY